MVITFWSHGCQMFMSKKCKTTCENEKMSFEIKDCRKREDYLWVAGKCPNKPTNSLKLYFLSICVRPILPLAIYFGVSADLPSSSGLGQWCWSSRRESPRSLDQRFRPGSAKRDWFFFSCKSRLKWVAINSSSHNIINYYFGGIHNWRLTFLRNFLITLAIVLRE